MKVAKYCLVSVMCLFRILPGIAILSGQIFVCGGEVDSKILSNGEVFIFIIATKIINILRDVFRFTIHRMTPGPQSLT